MLLFIFIILLLLLFLYYKPSFETFNVLSDLDHIILNFNTYIQYNVTSIPDISNMIKEPYYIPFKYNINPYLISFISSKLQNTSFSNDKINIIKYSYYIYNLGFNSDFNYYVLHIDFENTTSFFTETLIFFIHIQPSSNPNETSLDINILACTNKQNEPQFKYNPYNNIDQYTTF